MKITDKTMPILTAAKQRPIPAALSELGLEFRMMHGKPLVAKAKPKDPEGRGSLPKPNFPKAKSNDQGETPTTKPSAQIAETFFKVANASVTPINTKQSEAEANPKQEAEATPKQQPVPNLETLTGLTSKPQLNEAEVVVVPTLGVPKFEQNVPVPSGPNPNPEPVPVANLEQPNREMVLDPNLEVDANVPVVMREQPDLAGLLQPQKPMMTTATVQANKPTPQRPGQQAASDPENSPPQQQPSPSFVTKTPVQGREGQTIQIGSKDMPDGLLPEVSQAPTQSVVAASKPEVPRPSLNELADRIAKHIMTSAPGEAKPEVRIQLKESVMPQTQLQLVREDGYLTVRVVTASGETHGMLREQLQGLRHQLETRLGEHVEMELRFQGEDGEGRSKGYFRYEDDMEGAS